jgi:hypothetical protein
MESNRRQTRFTIGELGQAGKGRPGIYPFPWLETAHGAGQGLEETAT